MTLSPIGKSLLILAMGTSLPWFAQATIIDSKHNLSASGPGPVKTFGEDEICIFCHAPHSATPATPIWNRTIPENVYTPYSSSTLEAVTGQPTHVSKLCLSCHDGTIALGSVKSMGSPISGLAVLSGRARLTTDLSDDHPVSFVYDSSLVAQDPELINPNLLPEEVALDSYGQVQCTTCHATHSSIYPKLLVMDPAYSSLCLTCHDKAGWSGSVHATSNATWSGTGTDPWPQTDQMTVAENACENCHSSHSASSFEQLLTFFPEEETCLSCHKGTVADDNIGAEILKPYRHPVDSFVGTHDPTEDSLNMSRHVECQDCHNPHAATTEPATAPNVSGALRAVEGTALNGTTVIDTSFEYEICLRCHGNGADVPYPEIQRQIAEPSEGRRFDPSNPSYHPVAGQGQNPDVPGLISPLTESSIIYCTDCHANNDGPGAGGQGPSGPHGSIWRFLLEREYRTADFTSESYQAYALCYKCHDRTTLLGGNQTNFKDHRKHIKGEDTPCSACHDPHGISSTQGNSTNNSHLINFDIGIVQPDPDTGRLEFIDLGSGRGECYLDCHGKKHSPEEYP